jgi:hypothetical protein
LVRENQESENIRGRIEEVKEELEKVKGKVAGT